MVTWFNNVNIVVIKLRVVTSCTTFQTILEDSRTALHSDLDTI